jgi:hypothetical protein
MASEGKTTAWGPFQISIAVIGLVGSLLALLANADAVLGAWTRWTTKPTALETTWQGEWASPRGTRFTYAMEIAVTPEDQAEGVIRWQLAGTPPGYFLENRIGDTADEFVRGTFDREKRLMLVEGYAVSDPTLLVTDAYRLAVDKDGISFIGMTKDDGGNEGDRWRAQTTGTVIISEVKKPPA